MLFFRNIFVKGKKLNGQKIILIWLAVSLMAGCAYRHPLPRYPASIKEVGRIKAGGYQIVPVILYHDLRENPRGLLQLTIQEFQEQMAYLKKNGFHVISLKKFFDFINLKQGLPDKSVVITIDDGWKSTYTFLYPILKKYGFPATLFIYTDFISPGNPSSLTWEMIKEMSDNGIDIQAHSKTHQFKIPWKRKGETEANYQKRLKQELLIPKKIIEKHTGKKVEYIAYPYGQFNKTYIQAAIKYGYKGGLTVFGATLEKGIKVKQMANPVFVDPFEIRRVQILAGRGLKKFANKLITFRQSAIYDGRYDRKLIGPLK